jgi:hypothetical protein
MVMHNNLAKVFLAATIVCTTAVFLVGMFASKNGTWFVCAGFPLACLALIADLGLKNTSYVIGPIWTSEAIQKGAKYWVRLFWILWGHTFDHRN